MFGEDDDDGELFDLERQASEAEERGPRVDIPSVDDPSDSLPDPSRVDPDIQQPFLAAVVYANVALLGVSLGLMLVGFRGNWRVGGAAIAIGVLAAVRVYQTVRAFKQRDRDGDDAGEGDGDGAGDEDGADDGDDDALTAVDDDAIDGTATTSASEDG